MNITFAIEVEELISKAYIEKAIEICRQGISEFPDYPAAYFLLAKAFAAKGDKAKSREVLTTACELFPTNIMILKAMDDGFDIKIETPVEIAEEESHPPEEEETQLKETPDEDLTEEAGEIIMDPVEEADEEVIISSDEPETETQNETTPEDIPALQMISGIDNTNDGLEYSSSNISLIPGLELYQYSTSNHLYAKQGINLPNIPGLPKKSDAQKEELTQIRLDDIQKIKITELAEEIKKFSSTPKAEYNEKENSPISDTLASIYENQGAYGEAIKAYKTLIEKNPEKKEQYLEKIEDLKKKLKT